MSTLQWILAVGGFFGWAGLVAAFTRLRTWTRAQRFFRLWYRDPVDIVASTSDTVAISAEGDYPEPAVALSNLEAAAVFSKAVGDLRLRKDIVVHPSEEPATNLNNDLVLIGGPRQNHITVRFLQHLKWAYPDHEIEFEEPQEGSGMCRIALDRWEERYRYPARRRGSVVDGSGGPADPPGWDYGVVIAWINPFVSAPRRAFLTAGFTALGTAAATRYLLDHMMSRRYARHRREFNVPRMSWSGLASVLFADPARAVANRGTAPFGTRWWRVRPPSCFVLVLRIEFTGPEDYEVSELKFLPLALPERHPLDTPRPTLACPPEESVAVREALATARGRPAPHALTYAEVHKLARQIWLEAGADDDVLSEVGTPAPYGLARPPRSPRMRRQVQRLRRERDEMCRYLHASGVIVVRPRTAPGFPASEDPEAAEPDAPDPSSGSNGHDPSEAPVRAS
ncbi:MAG: hypothetical protein M3340_02785 [Actinomycetota bacterium]|nr:hypothetical protein [Actinomycetota bacterium]